MLQVKWDKKFSDHQNVKVEKIKSLVNEAAHYEAKGGSGQTTQLTTLVEALVYSDALFALNKALNGRDTY